MLVLLLIVIVIVMTAFEVRRSIRLSVTYDPITHKLSVSSDQSASETCFQLEQFACRLIVVIVTLLSL